MMSSEEETDCLGLYSDKLAKKAKRARQRVDAGEPRNSYSSIPNFTSRPSFMSGGLYSAIFSQNQQHFGLFGPALGSAKMLNELLGRQIKREEQSPGDLQPGRAPGEDSPPPTAELAQAHHMLRDILQGRKKELMQLERELRGDRASPDNNNSISSNNNNNEIKNGSRDSTDLSEVGASAKRMNGIESIDSSSGDETNAATPMRECHQEGANKRQHSDMNDDAMSGVNGAVSESGRSIPSPNSVEAMVTPKVEMESENQDKDGTASPIPKGEQIPLDMKRARVENIVSTMRSSPVPIQPQVNGCKKRKLYQPQQHESVAERYAAGIGLGLNLQSLMLDDDDDDDDSERRPPIHQKLVEKHALKNQLRTMQEQLAEMQQKYVQLCNRMEQESETQDNEEAGSDIEQDIENAEKMSSASPAQSPIKETPPCTIMSNSSTPNVLSQVMSKMMSAKVHPNLPHPHAIPPNFNGAIPMISHMAHTPGLDSPMPHAMQHPSAQHPHHAISNAAAMYLGVSQKLFMEQEVRQAMAKEAAVAAAHAAEQQQAAHHHHQQQQHQQQQQQQQQHQQHQEQQHRQNQSMNQHSPPHSACSKTPSMPSELAERLSMMRSGSNSIGPVSGSDLEGLADVLKTEISASLSNLVDSIVTRFVHQRRFIGKQTEAAAIAAEQLNKDLMLASQMLDRKSPRLKSADRPTPTGNHQSNHQNIPNNTSIHSMNNMLNHPSNFMNHNLNMGLQVNGPRPNGSVFPPSGGQPIGADQQLQHMSHMRPSPTVAMFQAPKPPQTGPSPGGLYMNHLSSSQNPFCTEREQNPEQNEALSLVVTPKKKRHKVTDTRITPRTVSRILAQDGSGPSPGCPMPADSPSPRPYHPPPSMLPVSLPTSVAIPNPSLHESQVFSPFSPFFSHHGGLHGGVAGRMRPSGPQAHSPPSLGLLEARDSPPLPHAPALLHPALLAAARHSESEYSHPALRAVDNSDLNHSDCNSTDLTYDGIQPTSSTLTPMHLRKAKLMFFWVRYPSSAVLKMYFPDIKFNKNNTAQLVKWFSNFREFYYIQMEKYARQAISEGVKSADELHVAGDSEIYRVLNLHYNRNNHIEVCGPQVPSNFRYVVEQTLREFFRAIQGGKDAEQSWKKSIYKVISRLDDPVPEYFKSPNFLEQLE